MIFDAKSVPYYPKEIASCFIVQVLPQVEEPIEELVTEVSKTACVDKVYDSPCLWDRDSEEDVKKNGLLEDLCAFS